MEVSSASGLISVPIHVHPGKQYFFRNVITIPLPHPISTAYDGECWVSVEIDVSRLSIRRKESSEGGYTDSGKGSGQSGVGCAGIN